MSKPWVMAVKAVIIDAENRTLLLRRSPINRHFQDCWEWPGGKLDPGEDYATAVVRETREEIGLEVEITGLAGATTFEMEKVHVVLLCMETRVTGGVMHLSEEHDAYDWVPLSKLQEMDLIEGAVRNCMLEYAMKNSKA